MRHIAADMWRGRSVGRSAIAWRYPAKMTGPIQIPFSMWARVGPSNHVLVWVWIPSPQGNGRYIQQHDAAFCRIPSISCSWRRPGLLTYREASFYSRRVKYLLCSSLMQMLCDVKCLYYHKYDQCSFFFHMLDQKLATPWSSVPAVANFLSTCP